MKTLRHIEVEPLGDQRWDKIERSLLARMELGQSAAEGFSERRRRRWVQPALLVAAALVAVFGITMFAARDQPQHASIEAPSRITTGANSSYLALPGLALDVEPHSAVVVGAETSDGLLIVLDRGGIVCQVAPRPAGRPLIVQAGAARVRVVGTRFSVTRLGEAARVKVVQGEVEVLSASQRFRVTAGQEWPRALPTPSATLPAIVSPEPSLEAQAASPGAAPPLASPPANRAGSRTRASTAAPVKVAPSSGPEAAPATARDVAVAEPAPSPGPSRQGVFEQATKLERGDPARAVQLYRTLESGADSWAQNALYARGRLEASRGNGATARRLLEQYLKRFPQGSNAEDARAVLRRLR
jgi:hypothetical protein